MGAAGGGDGIHALQRHSGIAVAGGLLAVGGGHNIMSMSELYDEETGRWLTLPHKMVEERITVGSVSVSAAALSAAP